MKFGKRTIACVMTAAAVLASSIVGAGACTGVYVGKDVSASGYTMFGRSEDIGSAYNKIFFVHWIFLCGSTAVPEERIPPIQRQETAVPEQRYRT